MMTVGISILAAVLVLIAVFLAIRFYRRERALRQELRELQVVRQAPADPPRENAAGSRPAPETGADLAATTPESTAMAKELKRRGFIFVGPTTAYATMQAAGLVNDHLMGCSFRLRR